jgi:Na+:H+ antiporter, NhaA family
LLVQPLDQPLRERVAMTGTRSRFASFVYDHSLLLLGGTVAAVVWANIDQAHYEPVAHALHFWTNDVGMVFFFALAAKEVFEATLPGGSLSSIRRAMSPLGAAIGGMAAPALIYAGFVAVNGPEALRAGWAIPCATDIAFSAMVARLIFPRDHPAIPFLLLLAIADDAFGLVILALFYPSGSLSFVKLGVLMTAALLLAVWLRRRNTRSFWPYVIGPGSLSWAALYVGGLHPALALVPVVPFMPHAARDLGLFDPRKEFQPDTLNRFEHWWAVPVQFALLFFGLANAGVPFEQIGAGTVYVLIALLVGKPIGIMLFTGLGHLLGAHVPHGLRTSDLLVVGMAASIGFTVALFFATAAFPEGAALAETKMGALLSFVAAPLAIGVAKLLRVGRSRRPSSM